MAVTLTSSYQLIATANTSKYSQLKLYGKLNSQSTTNNTSSITLQARLYGNGGSSDGSYTYSGMYVNITAGGTTETESLSSVSYKNKQETTLATKTFTISHNADGTYTNKSVSSTIDLTRVVQGTASGTINIKQIPRASTFANSKIFVYGINTITLNSSSSGFRHDLTYTLGSEVNKPMKDANGNNAVNVAGTFNWNVPNLTSQFGPREGKKTGSIKCVTKNNGVTIGTVTKNLDYELLVSLNKPTYEFVSKEETSQNVIEGLGSSSLSQCVINQSKPRYKLDIEARNGAYLKSITIKCGDNINTIEFPGVEITTYNLDYTFQNAMVTNKVEITITDTRDIPNVYEDTIPIYATYIPIALTSQEVKRYNIVTGEVTANFSGVMMPTTYQSEKNNVYAEFLYKANEEGADWSDPEDVSSLISYDDDDNRSEWYLNGSLGEWADSEKSYSVIFRFYDDWSPNNPLERPYTINKSIPSMSLGEFDLQINGELNLADESGKNIIEIFDLTGTPRYNESSSYSVGDYVVYDGSLYKCIVNTTGTFDDNDWTSTDIMSEIESGGGGGGGTSNYNDLTNKPSINNVTLSGNKSLSDLGINIPTKTSDLTNDSGFIDGAVKKFLAYEYSSSARYYRDSIVLYNGKFYVCIYSTASDGSITNIPPTNTTNWAEITTARLLSEHRLYADKYRNSATYYMNDWVTYKGKLYQCYNLLVPSITGIAPDDPTHGDGHGGDSYWTSNVTANTLNDIGYLYNLNTTNKKSLVNAINEVKGDIPTTTSELTNDSGFIVATTFDLDDVRDITSTSDETYIGIKNCIDNNIPFKIQYIDLSSTNTHEVTYAYKYSGTYEFGYETDSSINTIVLSKSGTTVTVTETFKDLQEKITSTNKLDYSYLSNTPTIPTVNNATLTIQKNGTTVNTFTANASSNVTANITVPTKMSDITNDSGYITSSYHDSTKQDSLVSGTNIKTINNQSLLGSGNITIQGGGGSATDVQINGSSIVQNDVANIAVEGTYNATTNKIATVGEITNVTGDLEDLTTTDKDNLVDAINEVNSNMQYGAVLYENSSGSSGNIYLSDSSANYDYLEIYYKSNDGDYSYVKVNDPDGKAVALLVQRANTTAPRVYGKNRTISISGRNITTVANSTSQYTINNSATGYVQVQDYILITKVIGYTNSTIPNEIEYSSEGEELYVSSGGTTATLTLNKNVSNYHFLEIFYGWSGGSFGLCSTRIDLTISSLVNLSQMVNNNNYLYFATSRWTASGTSLTFNAGEYWRIGTSGSPTRNTSNQNIAIYKVLGYK